MSPDDFAAELYRDFDWRWDELISLKNLVTHEPDVRTRSKLRKSLVVVLYSHLEGFCVFSLVHYLNGINRAKVSCKEVVPAILAGAWAPIFRAVESGDAKNRVFRTQLPDDRELHRHWRRQHFVEEIDRFLQKTVNITEKVIDTESNLKPYVLKRNLFLLGLNYDFVDNHADNLHNLLGRRNRIAHGEDRRGVEEREFNEYEEAVFVICCQLIDFLDESYRSRKFCKTVTNAQ